MTALAHVSFDHFPDLLVAHLSGEIDLSNVAEIRSLLVDGVDPDVASLVLDLSGTTYLDSTGIRLLFEVAERMQTRRRQLRLVVTDQALIRRVILLTHLQEQVPIDTSVDRAVAAMRAAAG